jgi:hypothetical protein
MQHSLCCIWGKTVTEKRTKENKKVMEIEFSMTHRENCSSTAYREREVHTRKIRRTESKRKKWERTSENG